MLEILRRLEDSDRLVTVEELSFTFVQGLPNMSLTLAVLLIVAAFIVLYVGLRLLAWLLAIPDRVRAWRGNRAQARDHELLERGWIGLLEGR